MDTIFVDHKLDIGGGQHLFLDGNSKITAGNGTFAEPVANAFSLPSGKDGACPYATPACLASCYTLGLKKHAPALAEKFSHNERVMREILAEENDEQWLASLEVIAQYAQSNCSAGFRWHVSGDVFSLDYADWIAQVCKAAPDVPFWIYTRSFPYLEPLVGIPNLVVNLSADRDNWIQALEASMAHGWLRLCYMSTQGEVPPLLPSDVIFPDYSLRGRDLDDPTTSPWWQGLTQIQRRSVCPPDMFGQSEKLRCGPCKKCMVNP